MARSVGILCLTTALLTLGNNCTKPLGYGKEASKRDIGEYANLLYGVTGGFDVLGFHKNSFSFHPVSSNYYVLSLSPDLSGHLAITDEDQEGARSLRLSVGGLAEQSLYAGPWEIDRAHERSFAWGAPDGRNLLLLSGGQLQQWSACGNSFKSAILAKDVAAFTFTSSRVFWVPRSSPKTVAWRSWGNTEEHRVNLNSSPVYLLTATDELLILFEADPKWYAGWTGLRLFSLTNGQTAPLVLPLDAKVYNFLALKGQPVLLMEIWEGGRERLDGTEYTQFIAWNYLTNKIDQLGWNEKMYRLHEKPANTYLIPSICGE